MFFRKLMDTGGGPAPSPGDGDLSVEVRNLAEKVTLFVGSQKEVDARTKSLKEQADQVIVRLDKMDEWTRAMEGKMNSRAHGLGGRSDNLVAAIPQRMRICPSLWERTGCKPEEAIQRAAIEAWFKNAIHLHNPTRRNETAELLKEMENIEAAFGITPEIKAMTKAALAEGAGATGGFTVPTPLEAEVLRVMEDNGVVRSLARKIPMTAFKHLIPSLANGVTINIVAEAGTISDSLPASLFGQSTLEAKMFVGLATVSMQLVQDNAIGLMGFLQTLFGEQTALLEDKQALEGDGTGVNFTGLVAASGVKEVQATIAGSPTNGGPITFADLVSIKWKARKRGTRRGGAWIMAPEHMANCEKLVDDQNRPIFVAPIAGNFTVMSPAGGAAPPDGVLLGFPAYAHAELNIARTVGSATNCSNLYFGPYGHGMIFGDLLGMQFGVSEHVNWTTAQLSLRMVKRTAILVGVGADFTKGTGYKIA